MTDDMEEKRVSELASTDRAIRPQIFISMSVVIVLLSAIVRFVAALDDFWFDEIWSWEFAAQSTSSWKILTEIPHDNNHFLNTWIIYFIGPDHHWFWYRLPAVMAGVGTVLLAGVLGARRGQLECLSAMVLTGGSFLLIQYSSEARGYTYAVFFSLLCVWLMQSALERPSWHRELRFGVVTVLGLLSQLTFFYCYAAIGVWSLGALCKRKLEISRICWTLIRYHAIPLLFIGWLYYANLQYLQFGGGPRSASLDIARKTLSLAVGGPESGSLSAVTALMVMGFYVAGVVFLWRSKSSSWLLFATIMLLPAVVLGLGKTDLLFVRYFLVNVVFLLLLLSQLLAALYEKGLFGRTMYFAGLGVLLLGNIIHTFHFVRTGRGDYFETVQMMLRETSGPVMTVGSDHDYRNPMILRYYHRRSDSQIELAYITKDEWRQTPPEWLILHSRARDFVPKPQLEDAAGNRFVLIQQYPYAGLSGWHWAVYRIQ